jgi:aspartyl-tRNA(Asn)/glutamyl-tRNA(Gln) amidotransferase subunit A
VKARDVAQATLARIREVDRQYNCFTALTAERALAEAEAIDRRRARGEPLGPLAGVPYAVKNLFDIEGLVTLAGSKINADNPPAARDAFAIRRLKAAGAVLVGALNMEEYAYGFTTENFHYGATRNPHDTTRIAGGSSGGSGAAVAAGLVPLALGSDTNGSIRVPASLCGVFGLKPTFGRLSRQGAFPFVASLDHVGPFARSVADLAAAYDAMQGYDADDPVCAQRPAEPVTPVLPEGIRDVRIAIAGGAHYESYLTAEARAAVDTVARCLDAKNRMEISEPGRARAAALLITFAEASNLHLPALRSRPADFDPLTRERFLAGALLPAHWILQAQRFRQWYRQAFSALFEKADVLIAAATPFCATPIGQETITLNGQALPLRPSLGLLTAPLSFIGVPVVSVPVRRAGPLPIGVQLIAAPWREDQAFRVAAYLEREGASSV